MPKESFIFGIAGMFFGLLVGWMLGSQQTGRSQDATTAPAATSAATAPATGQPQPAGPAARVDELRVRQLQAAAEKNPADAEARIALANLYFDAERFPDAARWYESALRIDPQQVSASTDLGIAYYYMNQADKALAQFDRSLAIDAGHVKTLLNVGIVRAFGKQDLEGAATAWRQVVKLAPGSEEARMADKALEGLRSAHPPAAPGGSSSTPAAVK